MRGDYRSTDLAGAARSAQILADGFDLATEPDANELAQDLFVGTLDLEVREVFEEIYGPAMAAADTPF